MNGQKRIYFQDVPNGAQFEGETGVFTKMRPVEDFRTMTGIANAMTEAGEQVYIYPLAMVQILEGEAEEGRHADD